MGIAEGIGAGSSLLETTMTAAAMAAIAMPPPMNIPERFFCWGIGPGSNAIAAEVCGEPPSGGAMPSGAAVSPPSGAGVPNPIGAAAAFFSSLAAAAVRALRSIRPESSLLADPDDGLPARPDRPPCEELAEPAAEVKALSENSTDDSLRAPVAAGAEGMGSGEAALVVTSSSLPA
jgi:hypothetical protein